MDLSNISKDTPIEPEIELDGGYAYCIRCTNEIDPHNKICPYCHQMQDWSWLGKYTKNNDNNRHIHHLILFRVLLALILIYLINPYLIFLFLLNC